MTEFAEWDSFYLIVGAAAATLIGLQFIFMSLIANSGSTPGADAGAAFGTPTVVHFCTVLFSSAILRAPWKAVAPVAWIFTAVGIIGVGYIILVARSMRRQKTYTPVFEDWAFYAFLPAAAYLILTASAIAAFRQLREALFGIAASALLLLFIGIRNSWDSASYHVLTKGRVDGDAKRRRSKRN